MIQRRRCLGGGFTLIELLIGVAIVSILAAIGIPAYMGFVQKARETALIAYLAEVHKGQIALQLETDSPSFSGDFDELEETGFIPNAQNSTQVRRRPPRRGGTTTTTTSSRTVYNYQLKLTAQDNPASGGTYTYTIKASPQNNSRGLRWFYLDQTGVIRAGMGSAGPWSPPAS